MWRTELGNVVAYAREVSEDVLAPQAATIDEEGRWPEEGVLALRNQLGGLVVPKRFGGIGHGLLAVAQVCEATGRGCASTSICFGMHLVASAAVAAKATRWQQERYLEPIAAGEHLTTLALSEPETGGEFWLPQTRMECDGTDRLRLTGTKSFVTNAGHADSYVVSGVVSDPGAPPGQFSCAVVDADTPGLEVGAPWRGFGMRGNASSAVKLRGAEVPRTQLLGEEGDQIWYIFNVVTPYLLMAVAGTYLGVVSAALDEVRAHLVRRSHGHTDRSLAALPLVQHRLGTMWAQVERARRLIYHAAVEGETGSQEGMLALFSAKAEVAETAERVINDAMSLVGGTGYGQDSMLQRHLRDARAVHVIAPVTDVLRLWVGRALLNEPLLEG